MQDSRRAALAHLVPQRQSTRRALLVSLAVFVLGYAVSQFPVYDGLSDDGRWALLILVVAAGLWLTEAIPAFAVSLLVIGLAIVLLGHPAGRNGQPPDWQRFLAPWGSPLIWLFFGGFVLAAAAANTGLDRWMARRALQQFGRRPALIVLGTMLTTAVLSMFISNTATATVMLAALVPLLHWDSAADRRLGKSMLLAIAFGANLGGMGTVIGTPPNAIAAGALAGVQPVNFAQWMMIGIPPAIVLLVVAWLYLIIRYLGRDGFRIRDDLRPPSAHEVDADPIQQLIVVATFAATVVLWITSPLHGLPTTVVSFLPTCVLTATGTLKAEDIRGLPWDILLLISGGLALGVAIEDTGLATWIIGQVPTEGVSPTTVTLAIAGLALVLSNLMSNTATANMLMPIAIAMAPGSEVSLVIPLALSASAAMCLPISTPPNAIVYGSGRLSAADLLVAGLVVGILAPLLLTYWVPWVAPFCLAR